MRRRNFLQRIGLGASGILISNRMNAGSMLHQTGNHEVEKLDDLLSSEGYVILRINFKSTDPQYLRLHTGKIRIQKGKLARIKTFFFHEEIDEFDPQGHGIKIESDPGHEDVLVLWIANAEDHTSISFPVGSSRYQVTIGEIIKEKDVQIDHRDAAVTISYLLDKEIGELDPTEIGITENPENFSFTVMADPQGGNPYAHEQVSTRMRIHNAFIDESVRVVNELDPRPLFNLVVGDIVDGQGHHEDFRAMNDMLSEVKVPTLYELGNHETRYKSKFTPGYNMSAFDNYFAAQKELNGMEKLLYSFNLGSWHFIVWPDPLRANFWQLHPHYFDWLERDLEKHKDRPCFFFQHIPVHPIGINPLINYAESVTVKRTLLDILSKQGNVKYILSGHVHIPMKAAVKTSVEFRGIKMINLPAAGYRPRAFGEEDFNGGPSQGVAIVDIKGEEATIKFKNVVNEQFTFPDPPVFIPGTCPLWLKHKWELNEASRLKNPDFSEGLKHWHRRFVYTENQDPSNICEVRQNEQNKPYVYLFTRPRGYQAPGQDRLPQDINRICQVIKHQAGMYPIIKLMQWLDPKTYSSYSPAGTYIWIEGFERGLKRLNVVYSTDHVYWHLGGSQSQLRTVLPVHMEITKPAGIWRELLLNPINDFKEITEMVESFPDSFDTLAITLGVWSVNEGHGNQIGAGYTGIQISQMEAKEAKNMPSTIANDPIPPKEQKYMWWHGAKHVAGEHMNVTEDLNKFL